MTLVLVAKLSLSIRPIGIGTQKIDGFFFKDVQNSYSRILDLG